MSVKKTLVAGWFSFDEMGASAGDLMARDLACEWLECAGHRVQIALAPPFEGGIDWRDADPGEFSNVVFVCGPFGNGPPVDEFMARFQGVTMSGLDLSMLQPLEEWNPFRLLLERDSNRTSRPDIAFLSRQDHVPLVGAVLIDDQPEYAMKASQKQAHEAIRRLLHSRNAAVVPIDTRLDVNTTGLRTAEQIESVIARMDVVVTTRLHGTVLSLKNGVPAVVIDSVSRGAKVLTQARSIGWPIVFRVEELSDEKLAQAFDYCLTEKAREEARACGERAKQAVARVRDEFIAAMERLR